MIQYTVYGIMYRHITILNGLNADQMIFPVFTERLVDKLFHARSLIGEQNPWGVRPLLSTEVRRDDLCT